MKTLLSSLLLVLYLPLFGQNSQLTGTVYLSDSITPYQGATIGMQNSQVFTRTDHNGQFKFSDLQLGEYILIATAPGYKKIKFPIAVQSAETITVKLYLHEEVTDLPEAVVHHVTLTGGEKGIRELPGSAYYLSPKELEKFSYTDINRTLRSVPGVNIREEDGFGLRPNISLRGTGIERSAKITLMEDGVLIAPAPYAAPAAYYFPSGGRMQAVEIVKGSSQIKYGPYTTGGAINFISSQIPSEINVRVIAMAGSFNSRNLHVFLGNSHKYIGYSLEAFNYSSDGFKVLDNGGNTGFDKKDLLAKFRVRLPSSRIPQSLTFKAGITTEIANETYLGLTREDFQTSPYRRYAASQKDNMTAKQSQLSATYFIQPAKSITFTSTIYRNDFHRNWYKLDAVKDSSGNKKSLSTILGAPDIYSNHYEIIAGLTNSQDDAFVVRANNRNYYSQGIQSVLGFDLRTGYMRHDIDLGFRYHQDHMDRYQYEDTYSMHDGIMFLTGIGSPGSESNRLINAIAAATYLQYKGTIKRLSLTAGIRNEQIWLKEHDFGKNDPNRTASALVTKSNEVNIWIPGISIDYKFTENLSSFAGVHKGFAPPGVTTGSMPEESVNYELGTKFYKKSFSSQLVLFFNDYSNLLGADMAAGGGTGTGALFNGGSAKTVGLEYQLIYDLLAKASGKFQGFDLPLTVGYTYTDAYFTSDFVSTFEDWGTVTSGEKLPFLSAHQLSVNLSLEHARFALNIGTKYTSAMRTVAGTGPIPDHELIPSVFLMDAGVKYRINRNMTIVMNAMNLTNTTYLVSTRPAGSRPGMPFTLMGGIKASF